MLTHLTDGARIALFLILVAVLTALSADLPTPSAGPTMLVPALAALLMLFVVTRDGLRPGAARRLGFGELRGGPRLLLIAALLPMLVVTAGYLALPLLHVAPLILPSGETSAAVALRVLALLPFAAGSALMEEVGWRGYLLPRLAPLGRVRAGLLLGAIWSAWHLPLLLAGKYHAGEALDWTLLLFVLHTTAFGFFLNELRWRSGSVWPAALAHGAHNAAWHVLRDLPRGAHTYALSLVAGEKGLVTVALYATVAVLICLEAAKQAAARDVRTSSSGSSGAAPRLDSAS